MKKYRNPVIYAETTMTGMPASCAECALGDKYGCVGDVKCRVLGSYFTGNVKPPHKERPDECPLILGCDVLDDHIGDAAKMVEIDTVEEDSFADRLEAAVRNHEEDNGMEENKKLRICELLGVEAGEAFTINGLDGVDFWICSDGTFGTSPRNVVGSSQALLLAIEHPDHIIRKHSWTEAEVMLAKGFVTFYQDGEIERRDDDALLFLVNPFPWRSLPPGLFPSLRPGEKVRLADIAGGGDDV